MHSACLMVGSNIQPLENTRKALELLANVVEIQAISTPWETASVGFDGPNFLNTAVLIQTGLEASVLKQAALAEIEQQLGRVRTANKNAPRTIDLDIILFDGQVCDENLWRKAFIALPVGELFPDLCEPVSGERLAEIGSRLRETAFAQPRPELNVF